MFPGLVENIQWRQHSFCNAFSNCSPGLPALLPSLVKFRNVNNMTNANVSISVARINVNFQRFILMTGLAIALNVLNAFPF